MAEPESELHASPTASPPNASAVYVGFWMRALASAIDSLIVTAFIVAVLVPVYGWKHFRIAPDLQQFEFTPLDWLMQVVLPCIAVIVCWKFKGATPGKLMIAARIVDARTGRSPSARQFLLRFLGYLLALPSCGLGLLWVAWDARKQGWHDHLAGTVVIRQRASDPDPVTCDDFSDDVG